MDTENDRSRYNTGRDAGKLDGDMRIMRCHTQRDWHWDSVTVGIGGECGES